METELRESRKQIKWLEGEGTKPSVPFVEASEEIRCEEDERMEVDGDADSKKKVGSAPKRDF